MKKKPLLRIDLESSVVSLLRSNGKYLELGTQQWIEFYVALASVAEGSPDAGPFLSKENLHLVGAWRSKKLESVGKEVAHHTRRIEHLGVEDLLDTKSRTKMWRLRIPPAAIEWRPSRAAAEGWLSTRRATSLGGDTRLSAWARSTVEAALLLQEGKVDVAVKDALEAIARAPDPTTRSIALLFALRAAQRGGDTDLEQIVKTFEELGGWESSQVGANLKARAQAMLAKSSPWEHAELAAQDLAKNAARLEASGDVSGLAIVLNVLGLLQRRSGALDEARNHFGRALMFSLACNDFLNVQASLFNLGLVGYISGRRGDAERIDDARAPIDLAIRVANAFGYARDSMQAEILGATCALRCGDLDDADRYLDAARALAPDIASQFEQAMLRKAEVLAAAHGHAAGRLGADEASKLILRGLRAAKRLFAQEGHIDQKTELALAALEGKTKSTIGRALARIIEILK